MKRMILGVVIFAAIVAVMRAQFGTVVGQVTAKSMLVNVAPPQEKRIKCVVCGGSGRRRSLTNPEFLSSERCPTCRGTGWIDNPMFGR